MKRKLILNILFVFAFPFVVFSQTTWSITTDLSAIRSFKTEQQFWSAGHTIRGEMHINKKNGPYASVSYFIPGKFRNELTADAKSVSTIPQSISFRNNANMSIKQFTLGWKHYFKGSADVNNKWNLYGMAGLGIIGGRVRNDFQSAIDTSIYSVEIVNGESRFKRLTADLSLGWEVPVSGDIVVYNDFKVWVPASDYPSRYLLNNRYVPLIASLHLGVRVYFD